MANLLLEMVSPEMRILSEEVDERTGDRTLRVAVKWQEAGIINGNRRRYSKPILQREITRLEPMIREGRVMGCSFHPDNEAEVNDVSHLWESIRMEPNGVCTGVVKVLPTSKGKDVQTIIKAGGHIGMSSRGHGTVTPKEETIDGKVIRFEDVNEDFQLRVPGDFVLSPSVLGAGVVKVMEAQAGIAGEPKLEDFSSDLNRLSEAAIHSRFAEAQRSGYKGGLEDYKVLLDDESWKQIRGFRERFAEARRGGFRGDENDFLEALESNKG